LGGAINFYVGSDVRVHVPLPAVFGTHLPEAASLACLTHARQSRRFPAVHECFSANANPPRLQELSDSLQPRDLLTSGQKWLATFTPFFTQRERKQAGWQHRLFFALVEYYDNLIFRHRAALDQMGNGCSTPIAPSASRTRSPSSSAARLPSNIKASSRR
jgi:hypothetical protein